MLISDVVVFKPKLSEAGPAILAVPAGVASMEAMALALGFTGAAALAVDINQNPGKYNRAMRGMGSAYTTMMSWFKDNPDSETPPRKITADLEKQIQLATPAADLKGGEPTTQVGDNDVNLGLGTNVAGTETNAGTGTATPPAGELAGAAGAAGALAGANAISKATSNATSATKAAGATGAAGALPRLPISLGNVSADQMRFGQISVKDPLNLKRYG